MGRDGERCVVRLGWNAERCSIGQGQKKLLLAGEDPEDRRRLALFRKPNQFVGNEIPNRKTRGAGRPWGRTHGSLGNVQERKSRRGEHGTMFKEGEICG